jgi:small subunit ribosomal protein S17e
VGGILSLVVQNPYIWGYSWPRIHGDWLGKIRPTYIKRAAEELVKKFPDRFNADFENNKKVVCELADITTKKMRNRIAGYVTRTVVKNAEA